MRILLLLVFAACGSTTPANGDFELWRGGVPEGWHKEPDQGTNISAQSGQQGVSGTWLRFLAGDPEATAPLYSDAFSVTPGATFDASWQARIVNEATGGRVGFAIVWLDSGSEIDGHVVGIDLVDSVAFDEGPGGWRLRSRTITAPAGFARAFIEGQTSGDMVVDIDSVQLR